MKTMLETLRARLDEAIRTGNRAPMAHITINGLTPADDPETFHAAALEDVGSDYIQVLGRLIDRGEIREVQPINF